MKMKTDFEILEKYLSELSDILTILKSRPYEHIEARFHEEVIVPLKSLLAFAENIEDRVEENGFRKDFDYTWKSFMGKLL